MKAVIMAGGVGQRLRPLTCAMPKPMVPLLNKPVMRYGLELLKKHGINEAAVTLAYLPEQVRSFFGTDAGLGMNLHYFVENTPLGTAGSVGAARAMLDETFLVLSGDALTDLDIRRACAEHEKSGAMVTIVLKKVSVPLDYGVVLTDKQGKVTRFLEKPSWGEVFSDLANTGIYIINPEVLGFIPENTRFDFAKDLFALLLERSVPINGYITSDYWCDIGSIEQYMQAHRDLLDGKCRAQFNQVACAAEGVYFEPGAIIEDGCVIKPPCYIGANAHVAGRVGLEPYSVIGANVHVEPDCSLKRAVVWKDACIRSGAELRGCVIQQGAELGEHCAVFENAVIGDGSRLGKHAQVKPGVLIWPYKRVEAHATVEQNLVWGSGVRLEYSSSGIQGHINTDLLPETLAGFGSAYASTLKDELPGVALGRTDSPGALIAGLALTSGVLAQGADVFDLGRLTLPMLRYGVRTLVLCGGMFVKTFKNSSKLEITLVDSTGADIASGTLKGIQNAIERRDYRPVPERALGMLRMKKELTHFYMAELLRNANIAAMRRRPQRALIHGEALERHILFELLVRCGWQADISVAPTRVEFSRELLRLRADVGFWMEDAEKLTLFDSHGARLDDNSLIALIAVALAKLGRDRLILPVDVPFAVEETLASLGTALKRSPSARGKWMHECGADGSAEVWFDAVAAAMRIAECISLYSLSALLETLPKLSVFEKSVPCGYEDIGRILRSLAESEQPAQLIDGIRVRHEKGYALVRAEHNSPGYRIIIDAFNEEYAAELAQEYVKKIKAIQKSEKS